MDRMVPNLVGSSLLSHNPTSHAKQHRIPFYAWLRAAFLLWLILPQTQGARLLYTFHVAPFLQENERAIDDFISSSHERAKAAGLTYLRQLIELAKEHILGFPPKAAAAAQPPPNMNYAQSLLARFNLPAAKPAFGAAAATSGDVYGLLANAVAAYAGSNSSATQPRLVPESIRGPERQSFIAAQRERLTFLLSALDREAATPVTPLEPNTPGGGREGPFYDGNSQSLPHEDALSEAEQLQGRNISSAGLSDLSLTKSMSVGDFVKVDEKDEGLQMAGKQEEVIRPKVDRDNSGSGWMPWGWGSKNPIEKLEKVEDEQENERRSAGEDKGKTSAIDVLLQSRNKEK